MKRKAIIAAAVVVLTFAGIATAAALTRTVHLAVGQCVTIKKAAEKVCAPKAIVRTVTAPAVTQTVTVSPSPVGQTITGNGGETLPPMTLAAGVELHWTAQPDQFGNNFFAVTGAVDGNGHDYDFDSQAGSGQSYLGPGTYTLSIGANGPWTISF